MNDAERRLIGQIGANESWANTMDRTADEARTVLDSHDAEERAQAADRAAAAVAVRAGKPAASVGTPNADALRAERARLEVETGALIQAIRATEADMAEQFRILADEPKRARRLTTARGTYRAALEALVTARADYLAALSVSKFLVAAADASNISVQSDALNVASAAVTVNQIPSNGDRVPNLAPMEAARLLETTFGLEL